jgi:hypothetical protein
MKYRQLSHFSIIEIDFPIFLTLSAIENIYLYSPQHQYQSHTGQLMPCPGMQYARFISRMKILIRWKPSRNVMEAEGGVS